MDNAKVKAVLNWPTPKTVKELQGFLGFVNFYRRFIRDFSTVAALITTLLKGKPKKLVWTEAATSAFNQLKSRFTSAPILKHPDPKLPFIVEVDASDCGIGAVLSQCHGTPGKLHPCAFFSRKLSPAESNTILGTRNYYLSRLLSISQSPTVQEVKTVGQMHYQASMTQLIHRQDPKLFYRPSSSLHPTVGILWKKFNKPNKRSHPLQNARLARSIFHPVFAPESFNGSKHPSLLDILELIVPQFWSEIHFGGPHCLLMSTIM